MVGLPMNLIRIPSSGGSIYLALFNQLWYIQDMATLHAVFGTNPRTLDYPSLPKTGLGPTIASGSGLWQPQGSQGIYFVCTGNTPITAYGITSQAALTFYQFNGPVQTCSNATTNNWLSALITYGANIDAPT